MATIKLDFTHPQLGTLTRTKTLADADLVRLMTMARTKYRRQGDPAGPLTNAVAYDRLFEAMWGGWRNMTLDFEKEAAAKTATDAITPIEGTG
jgi:hypothetical protein